MDLLVELGIQDESVCDGVDLHEEVGIQDKLGYSGDGFTC